MAFKPSIVVFDACILYPFHLRNIVVQAAVDHLIEARWTNEIHEEWMRNLAADAPAIPRARLEATCRLMNEALPGAKIAGYEGLIPQVCLPDPNDRHVAAAAIAAGASLILTWNLRDFPTAALKTYDLRRQTPDAFLAGLYDEAPDLLVSSLANARRNLNKSRVSVSDFIDILRNQRLTQLGTRLRKHTGDL
jgi:hypothetical protein